MKIIRRLGKDEEGSALVVGIFSLTVLLGFLGLAMDVGNLVYTKTRMQNAVDAAAYAGGLNLPSTSSATTQATSILHSNGFPSVTPTVDFAKDATCNPSSLPEINVSMSQTVNTFFMCLLGQSTVALQASAKAILVGGPGGPFGYALFSNTSLTPSGNPTVNGSVHSNGKTTMSGNVNISGNLEGATGVTLSGNVDVDGAISADKMSDIKTSGNISYGSEDGNATNIAMPDYSSQLNTIFPSMTSYSGNESWSGNIPDLTNSIYVNGNVSLSGNINTTGAIVATGNITISGNVSLGSNDQLCLYSLNGNVTISGNVSYGSNPSAVIFAPKGTVNMSGNQSFDGCIVGNALNLSGNGTFNYMPSTVLPASTKHVKLVK